jgi:plastocyanin
MRALLLVGLFALLFLPAAHADNPVLFGSVGLNDSFTIDLKDAAGKHVSDLLPGTYTIVVHDYSAIHNFHLASNSDPTVDFKTGLEFVGDMTFTATFKDGNRYAYACEPHWQTMNGQFFVFTPSPPPPPPPPVRKLSGNVSAAGTVSLSAKKTVAGRYRITIADRSAKANFHLVGPGVNTRTAMTFKGSKTWSLTFAKGTYRYFSDSAPTRKKTLVVG